MKCPHCGTEYDATESIGGIHCHRICSTCHERFSTHESIVEDPIDKAKVSALLEEAEAFIQRARIELKCD